eukprot:Hpha_TRINITY_DN15526_c0_g4::TRINITY_DN15526_c0_g4_i1::g.104181::m.104181
MAQFLSEATHQRLLQRHNPNEYVDDAEVQAQKAFQSRMRTWTFEDKIRSMVVASRTSPQGQPLVWTGQDGDIALRNVRGEVCARIEKKRDTLVNAMLSHENYLWVGLSDGYLRVFDQKTLALVSEVKQHAGPVMCLLSVGQTVFSGGSDWQIYVWDPRDFRCIGQLSGHQNQVNCMAVEGDMIFSGGEDQAIRCWTWDPVSRVGEERIDNWPKVGHAGGIRAIVINEIFLFSASSDGGLKVWNTQNGQLVKYLDQRGDDRGAQVRITSLERDPSAQRIWAGSTDGIINVWDAQHLHLVGRLDMHCDAYVKNLMMVVRVSGMRVWGTNSHGVVKVWYSDTDEDADWATNQGGEQQDRVEELRSTVISNYKELEKRKQELKLIEDIDIRRKGVLAETLGTRRLILLRRAYYAKITRWLRWTHDQRNRRDMCARLMSTTDRGMRSIYYVKLRQYAKEKNRQRRKEQFADMLMAGTNSGRRNLYWRHLQEYTRRFMAEQKRKQLAEMLMRSTTKGTRHLCFLRWRRWARSRVMAKRKDNIASALLWNMKKGRLAVYWHRMIDFARREKRRHKHLVISDHLMANTARGMKAVFYRKLRNYAKRQRQRRKKHDVAEVLMCNTKMGMTRVFYLRWRDWAAKRAYGSLEAQWRDQKGENDDVQRILEQQSYMSEEEIESELKRLQQEIDDTWGTIKEEEKGLAAQDVQLRKLKRELGNTTIQLRDDVCEEQQMVDIVWWLKAPSVHCEHDFDELTELRGAGVSEFEEGTKVVRKQVWLEAKSHAKAKGSSQTDEDLKRETFVSEEGGGVEWVVWGDVEETWEKRRLKKAANGIRAMVVAIDTLHHQNKLHTIPSSLKREFIINSGTMLTLITAIHRMRSERLLSASPTRQRVGSRSRRSRAGGNDRSARARAAGAPLPDDGASRQRRSRSQRGKAVDTPLPKDASASSQKRPSRRSASRGATGSPTRGSRSGGAASPQRSRSRRSREPGQEKKEVSRRSRKPTAEEKPWLGWTLLMEDPHTGEPPEKCIIVHILPGSPAFLAEMHKGDVITLFGTDPITDIGSFKTGFKRWAKIGKQVHIKFLRGEEEYEAEVVVQSFADRDKIIKEAKAAIAGGSPVRQSEGAASPVDEGDA